MKYIVLITLILMGCEPQNVPKELVKPKSKVQFKVAEEPVTQMPAVPVQPKEEVNSPDKLDYMYQFILKIEADHKCNQAARKVEKACLTSCDVQFPDAPEPEIPVLDKCGNKIDPESNPENRPCMRKCWEATDRACKEEE